MQEWTHENATRLLNIDFVRFGIVGASGFIVTVIGKSFFTHVLKLGTTSSIFLGSELGVLSNFYFHEKWTYKHSNHKEKSVYKKFLHFQLSSLSGVLLITAIGSLMAKILGKDTLFGLVVAAAVAMFWNFFWTKYFIFRGKTPPILMNPEDTVAVEKSADPK
jgi:putative flippase GtrA